MQQHEWVDIRGTLKRLFLLPVGAAAALGLFVIGFGLVSDSRNFHGHAAGHWIMAIPVLFAALAFVRLPEARTAPRRIARLFVALLLIVLTAAQLLEGIGAFASGEGFVDKILESMHQLGEAATLFSMLALPLSFVLLTVVYALAATRSLVGRLSSPKGT